LALLFKKAKPFLIQVFFSLAAVKYKKSLKEVV